VLRILAEDRHIVVAALRIAAEAHLLLRIAEVRSMAYILTVARLVHRIAAEEMRLALRIVAEAHPALHIVVFEGD